MRRLHLAKETLAALTDDELAAVAGGDASVLCPTPECVTDAIEKAISDLVCRIQG